MAHLDSGRPAVALVRLVARGLASLLGPDMHVLPDVSSLSIRVPCLTRELLEKSRLLMDRARHGLISVTPCEGLNTVVWLKSGAECREAISSSLVDARKLWRSRAFLHWFVQEGWEPDDIEKAFGVLADYLDG